MKEAEYLLGNINMCFEMTIINDNGNLPPGRNPFTLFCQFSLDEAGERGDNRRFFEFKLLAGKGCLERLRLFLKGQYPVVVFVIEGFSNGLFFVQSGDAF